MIFDSHFTTRTPIETEMRRHRERKAAAAVPAAAATRVRSLGDLSRRSSSRGETPSGGGCREFRRQTIIKYSLVLRVRASLCPEGGVYNLLASRSRSGVLAQDGRFETHTTFQSNAFSPCYRHDPIARRALLLATYQESRSSVCQQDKASLRSLDRPRHYL